MKKIKGALAFFGVFLLYHIIFSSFFPVDENNVLQAPDWYVFVGIALASSAAFFATKGKKTAKNRNTTKPNRHHINNGYFAVSRKEESIPIEPVIPFEQSSSIGHKDTTYCDACDDNQLWNAVAVIFETNQPSVSMIQRKLSLGYANAAKLIDQMEALGIISTLTGSKPRSILVTREEAYRILQNTKVTSQNRETKALLRQPLSEKNILAAIDMMEGHTFEYWCADLLRKNGFTNVEVTPGSGDQGVDIIAVNGGVRFAIQCKCYSSNLGNTPVQEINAGRQFYRCQVGVVMTNSHFTKSAKELADATGILLWDREKLQEFIQTAGRPV